VLSELAEELAKLVSIIYQLSWLIGEVPDDWRVTSVTPIYRNNQKEDPGNYRPVSLTSVPGKIIILSTLTGYVKDNQGIRPSQHGFMKGKKNDYHSSEVQMKRSWWKRLGFSWHTSLSSLWLCAYGPADWIIYFIWCKRQQRHTVEIFSIHYAYTCIYFLFSWNLTESESRI